MAAKATARRSRLPAPQPSEDVTEPTVVRWPVGQVFIVTCAGVETIYWSYPEAIAARYDCAGKVTMRTETIYG